MSGGRDYGTYFAFLELSGHGITPARLQLYALREVISVLLAAMPPTVNVPKCTVMGRSEANGTRRTEVVLLLSEILNVAELLEFALTASEPTVHEEELPPSLT